MPFACLLAEPVHAAMQPSAEVEGRELTRLFAKAAARLEVVHRWIKPGIAVVADRSLVAQELHVEGSSYFVCFEGCVAGLPRHRYSLQATRPFGTREVY